MQEVKYLRAMTGFNAQQELSPFGSEQALHGGGAPQADDPESHWSAYSSNIVRRFTFVVPQEVITLRACEFDAPQCLFVTCRFTTLQLWTDDDLGRVGGRYI